MRRHVLFLFALAVACGPGDVSGSDEDSDPTEEELVDLPNVLLVTIDTLRADHLGCYGYFRDTSPAIDALALESLVFERCLVPMATTLPTHTSILTGTSPHEHGILANIQGEQVYERDPSLSTLAEYLKGIGYRTGAFVSAFPLRIGTGLETGFQTYDAAPRMQRNADETTAAALAWMEAGQDRTAPFFLWIHYFDPHGPYTPPAPHDTLFATDDELVRYMQERRFVDRAKRPTGQWNEAAEGVNAYDGEIHFTDSQLALVIDALRAAGAWDDTVVVLIGDHGEGLNQHGLAGHGEIWDEQLHVPFLLRVPGVEPRRVLEQVSAVDVVPILLHLLELPREHRILTQASGRGKFGRPRRAPLLGQSSPRQSDSGQIDYSLTSDTWKYIRRADGSEQLYERSSDPHELVDVRDAHPDVLESFRTRLEEMVARQKARGGGSTRAATAEEIDRMRGLGYGGDEDEDE